MADENIRSREGQRIVREAIREAAPGLFADVEQEIALRLERPPHFAVVRGLPGARASELLVAFSSGLGMLVEPYRQSWSRVVRHILPSRDKTVAGRVLNEFLHTDGTDWNRPNDYTCLFCVSPDGAGGGLSRIIGLEALCEGLDDDRLLEEVSARELPWRVANELGGGLCWAPILAPAATRIRWLRYTIDQSARDGLTDIDPDTEAMLERFEGSIERNENIIQFSLESGDMMFVDNQRCLHARTPIADPQRSGRDLRRTKVLRSSAPLAPRPTGAGPHG